MAGGLPEPILISNWFIWIISPSLGRRWNSGVFYTWMAMLILFCRRLACAPQYFVDPRQDAEHLQSRS